MRFFKLTAALMTPAEGSALPRGLLMFSVSSLLQALMFFGNVMIHVDANCPIRIDGGAKP
jgi:hypothetical protein